MQLFFLAIWALFSAAQSQTPCASKQYGQNAYTCVCNSTYCDTVPSYGTLGSNQAAVYTTTASGKRFNLTIQSFNSQTTPAGTQITPDENVKRQTIFGFGGAFTDSVGINLLKLSENTRQNLINTYFGTEGTGYTFGRVPIASCDFSPSVYSYDDVDGDMQLAHFALRPEDFNYKIPFIKMANSASGGALKLFASPWSAPGWMKTNGQMLHGGYLKGEVNGPYYQTWANYFLRFFEEYAKNGLTFWGATIQNEPHSAQSFQSMIFNATMERDYAKGVWGQTLRNNSLTKNLKLMVLDHNRNLIPDFSTTIFTDPDAHNILDGLAVHWYEDAERQQGGNIPASVLSDAHEVLNGKWILYTEACNFMVLPAMGQWLSADKYVHDILDGLNNWITGWVDWNLAVDSLGGPSWVNNTSDAPIIVSNKSDEFEKQPMYYGIGHISKFLVPGSTIIGYNITNPNSNIVVATGIDPSAKIVVVINNRDTKTTHQISIINKNGAPLNLALEPQSFTTVIYSECLSEGSTCSGSGQCCSPSICFNNKCQ